MKNFIVDFLEKKRHIDISLIILSMVQLFIEI